jgi:hypothetical protein
MLISGDALYLDRLPTAITDVVSRCPQARRAAGNVNQDLSFYLRY